MQRQRSTPSTSEMLVGAAMIVAPLALLVSTVVFVVGGGFNESRNGGVIQVYAMGLWFLVVVGLSRKLEGRAPRAAAILTVMGALGVAGGVAYGIDNIHVAVTGQSAEDMGTGVLALEIPGLMFPLANIGFGAMLARAGVVPRWSGPILVVAGVLFPVSRIGSIEPLAIVVDSLFVIALAPLGWRLLTRPASSEFDAAQTEGEPKLA